MFGLYFSNQSPEKIYTGHGNYYYNINQELYNYFNWPANMIPPVLQYQLVPSDIFYNAFSPSYRKNETFQNVYLTSNTSITYSPDSSRYIQVTNNITSNYYSQWNGNIYYRKFGLLYDYKYSASITNYGHTQYFPGNGYSLIRDSTNGYLKRTVTLNMGQPFYIYRYAHVLLTYAEAKARSGQLDASAYEAVNMIRRRANKVDINTPSKYDLQPGLSAAQFADSVVRNVPGNSVVKKKDVGTIY